jgi:hypothetical protein
VNRNLQKPSRVRYSPAKNAKNSGEELLSIRRGANWPARYEFKTFDRAVTVELPLTVIRHMTADDFEPGVSPDFLRLLDKAGRKHPDNLSESRKRELIIKKFERAVNSRRAS